MAFQADTATFVPVVPSFRGFEAAMIRGTTVASVKAGVYAGGEFSKAFAAGASTGFGRTVDAATNASRWATSAARSGDQTGQQFAAGINQGATRTGLGKFLKAPTVVRSFGQAGGTFGTSLALGIGRSLKGTITQRAGAVLGNMLYDKAAARLGQSRLFGRFTTNAAKAGDTAGTKIAGGVTRGASKINWGRLRSPALVTAAVGAGLLFGRRFARSAETESASRFNPGKLLGGIKGGLGGIATFATGGALALGGLATAGLGAGLKIAAGMETAKIGFTTMLGSGQKANKFLRDLAKFAAQTPFEFPELQTAASSLISAGIKAKDVIPIMRTLGDATAGMGTGSEGIQRATVALQQMNAAGRITAEDLNQLRDAGIPVYDLLAKATGKSKAEVVKLSQAGKLGKTELDQLMASLRSGKGLERFNGLMDKTSRSLSGVISTLKDTAGQGLANAITPAFPTIKRGVQFVTNTLTGMFSWISSHQNDIGQMFSDAGATLKSFGRIFAAVFGPAASAVLGTFKKGAGGALDFIATHQEDVVRGALAVAGAVLEGARGFLTFTTTGLHAFGSLSRGMADFVDFSTAGFGEVLQAAALSFSWVPGIGPKLRDANNKFQAFRESAIGGLRSAADGADTAANALDRNLSPAIDAAQGRLNKVGRTEISKAALRDSAAKAAAAIRDIGTKADGSQIKLKHFNDITKLGADQQFALRRRLKDAYTALHDQLGAMQKAGSGQAALTKAWETGKDRLYKEFRQMGLSKDEAKKLAAQYAGVKPKVETKVTQPGMTAARKNTRGLDGEINGLNDKTATTKINFRTNVDGYKSSFVGEYFSKPHARGGILPGFRPVGMGDDQLVPMRSGEGVAVSEAMQDPYERKRLLGMNKAVLSGRSPADYRRSLGEGYDQGGIVRNIRTAFATAKTPDMLAEVEAFRQFVATRSASEVARRAKRAVEFAGGPVGGGGYARALSFARAQVGKPYIWAAAGPRGYDCSGFMGAIQNVIEGKSPYHRRWSTFAFHGQTHAQGFTENKHSPFMIGVTNAGVGHTAGTLNGVNVESAGGVGVRMGRSARGWNNRLFPMHYGLARGGMVDAGIYDTGGILQPGLTLAYNGTGRPEVAFTEQQLSALGPRAGVRHTHFDGVYYGFTPSDLIEQARRKDAQEAALHPIRVA